ncbi:HlyD family efflux transporter periplasmic adaptor subunit [Pseudomonas sp. ZM23]|uniref:HlyD family efflux transporter periplasmic adaptor subunit n=1 Tax=Pseudomonas triclosanedens TaxID=2961893 RepID=A0ABY7A865_9PSED|nr:HlyD family efflux transporter periplasmic adaptor subunit [Pseudomonas triclosanedens]MCP8466299.1 HlyD family efflux transporter periplasmic adaptor subunit [Pseudomonas triclosanedens]MCP8471825.1 HlyD family efflux transporter periplasmic adaptor subunit [Pseudomonas triclosanedens]MCP8478520.1 HlyD family efflux transporter periplasmic adaptor subunit [Pseudomonas triclosanedens]WAI52284.1 HlyD family efflux transporter periplasmic adaptor subunit [Pseudomonas triclosanedens]
MGAEMKNLRLRRQLADPLLATTHPVYRPLLWTLLGGLLLFIAWASWAELDEVTRGDGRVVPFSRIQKIQSLEGGILDRLLVKEGDLVDVGQPLVRLDPTHFRTNLQESANQASVLRAAIARLDAEVLGKERIEFPADIDANGPLARSERELFASRRAKLQEGIQSVQKQIRLAQSQLDLVRPLVEKRAVSQMEALKLSQDIATLTGKLTELKSTYFQEAYTERADKKAQLAQVEPIVQQRQDQLRRTEILSPVRGRVNTILINTRGGVIQPGEPIMEVIPVEDRLLVEAKIKPRDVAFLVPGMPAKVKITAYDYTIYGDLKGTLEQISADTIEEDTVRGKESYYQVLIRTDGSQLKRGNEVLPIIPGMVADVDILSGKRSVLNYLLRPLIKARLY